MRVAENYVERMQGVPLRLEGAIHLMAIYGAATRRSSMLRSNGTARWSPDYRGAAINITARSLFRAVPLIRDRPIGDTYIAILLKSSIMKGYWNVFCSKVSDGFCGAELYFS